MGIQITIEGKDMVAAGWTEEIVLMHYEGEPIVFEHSTWIKDDNFIGSYIPGCFCADCNDWGSNKALFIKLGLFDIPHILS
jgi:hypothetical protein